MFILKILYLNSYLNPKISNILFKINTHVRKKKYVRKSKNY